MTTLAEAYEAYMKSEPHGTVIEMRCLKTGCEGDIYRARISALETTIAKNMRDYGSWQHRAERAEDQLQAIMNALKDKMIFKPTDNWQWGYRSGLLAILDVIKPDEARKE
jgi:hypothetical protein